MTGVCFKSVIYGCQAAFRYMKKQHSGAIVNVSSLAARCSSAGRSTLYGFGNLKSAINSLLPPSPVNIVHIMYALPALCQALP